MICDILEGVKKGFEFVCLVVVDLIYILVVGYVLLVVFQVLFCVGVMVVVGGVFVYLVVKMLINVI